MPKITTACAALLVGTSGCITVAEFRKLEHEVTQQRRIVEGRDVADLRADLRALRERIQTLQGRLEMAERQAGEALQEARTARGEVVELARWRPTPEGNDPEGNATGQDAAGGATATELHRYREARGAGREGRWTECIDLFQDFMQRFPTSTYADEAAFGLAECNYQRGNYREAILGFETVVSQYPEGGRAPDALYRQGEALLQLGPRYVKAARRAFQRVLEEHPETPRAAEAKRRLDLLAPP